MSDYDTKNEEEQKAFDHLLWTLRCCVDALAEKYVKGQREHGGILSDLSARQLAWQSFCEHVDGMVYGLELLNKLDEVGPECEEDDSIYDVALRHWNNEEEKVDE